MIDDQYIINYFYDTKNVNKINKYKTNNIPEDILKYLNNRFTDSESIKETIKRIRYNVEERPKCLICGNPVRWYGHKWNKLFYKTCCDEHENILRKQTTLKVVQEKYGVDNVFQLESVKEKSKQTAFEHYGTTNIAQAKEVREKFKQTCLERYGVENVGGTLESYEKAKATCLERYGVENVNVLPEFRQKIKQTCLERYGAENVSVLPEFQQKMKQTCLERYGVEYYTQSDDHKQRIEDIKAKCRQTKLKNKTYTSSKAESCVYNILRKKYSKIICQYYDKDKYPFNCDFYIPEIDTYIEYQGYYTHGTHPYDENDIDDIYEVNNLIKLNNNHKTPDHNLYFNKLKNWCYTDILKRNTAKANNLKYYEFWEIDDANKFINNTFINNG